MSFTSSVENGAAYPQPIVSLGEVTAAAPVSPRGTWRLELLQALPRCRTLGEVLELLGKTGQELLPGSQLFYCARAADGAMQIPQACLRTNHFVLTDDDHRTIVALAQRTVASGRSRSQALPQRGRCIVLATPVFLPGGCVDVLCAVGEAARDMKLVQAQLESLAAYPTFWRSWHEVLASSGHTSAQQLLALLASMHAAPAVTHAAACLVDQLQAWLKCHRVALALPSRGVFRLQAISGQQRIDARSEAAQALSSALDEVAVQTSPVRWTSKRGDAPQPDWPTLRRAARLCGAASVIGLPLRDEQDQVTGSLLVMLSTDLSAQQEEDLQGVVPLLAGAVRTVTAAHCSLVPRAWERAWSHARRHQRRTLLAVAAGLMILLCLPLPFRPASRFTIEPVTRRFVAAPFPGVLERSLVEPGDLVTQGQMLARMDEQELRWELAGWEAEYNQAAKRYDTALATQSAAAVQLSRFEMQQFQARIDTVRQRMDHLTIRSPLTGVIVRGDLKRSIGAPLTVGQTLYEIAPLEHMVAELEIPEREIPFIHPGQHVRLRLDADPLRVFTARIDVVHPRAELRHHATVFIAEVRLDNAGLELRPGMNGRAKAWGPWRPLGWILLRRPVSAILQWTGW